VTKTDKDNFSTNARKALIDRGWSMKQLADRIHRPCSTVSKAIHSGRFPLVRKSIAKALNLTLPA